MHDGYSRLRAASALLSGTLTATLPLAAAAQVAAIVPAPLRVIFQNPRDPILPPPAR